MKKYLVALFLGVLSFNGYGQESGYAIASYYGPGFHGKRTASGEVFNQNAMTTAHNSLKFGTIVKVSYKGKSVNVRVNDTGGFAKYGRQFDLSKGAAQAIGCPGVCKIKYEVISNKPTSM
jgi:rare lipoprotein A